MKKNKYFLAVAIAAVGLATLIITNSSQAQQLGIKRTELQRHDVSVSGYEAIQVRVDFDPRRLIPQT
jgi:hypothetical protein